MVLPLFRQEVGPVLGSMATEQIGCICVWCSGDMGRAAFTIGQGISIATDSHQLHYAATIRS